VFLPALMIWALCFSVANCGSAKVQSPQHVEKPAATPTPPMITLTNENPNGGFAIETNTIPPTADVLEIPITKVVNPSQIPLSVYVYLNGNQEKSEREVKRIPVGSFSIYPPDRPGKFLLSPPQSLPKLVPSAELQMTFVLKRVDESKPWSRVEVEVGRPTWRSDKKQ
jgi:hypothetical protein